MELAGHYLLWFSQILLVEVIYNVLSMVKVSCIVPDLIIIISLLLHSK